MVSQNGCCSPVSPVSASIAILDQCAGFIASIDEPSYGAAGAVIAGSTIGQHVRHCLDHFAAVLAGHASGVIDYDHRERDTPIERAPAAALQRIEELIRGLSGLGAEAGEARVRVRVMLSAEGAETDLGSTLGRELAFAAHHAVHHHAMMAAIAREVGVAAPAAFGKAPSTAHHERAIAAGASRG